MPPYAAAAYCHLLCTSCSACLIYSAAAASKVLVIVCSITFSFAHRVTVLFLCSPCVFVNANICDLIICRGSLCTTIHFWVLGQPRNLEGTLCLVSLPAARSNNSNFAITGEEA